MYLGAFYFKKLKKYISETLTFIIKHYNRSSQMSQPILDILINQFKKTNHLLPLESRLDTTSFESILVSCIDSYINCYDRFNLLDTILKICPEFNISGGENQILIKLVEKTYRTTLDGFVKRTRFDYHLNKINYFKCLSNNTMLFGLLIGMNTDKFDVINDEIFLILKEKQLFKKNVIEFMFDDLVLYPNISFDLLTDLDFSIVKKYLEKYDPRKSVNSLSHKPIIDVINNDLIFEISIGITRIITNETMILMEKLSKLHIDDLENIKKLMLSGVSTELLLKHI